MYMLGMVWYGMVSIYGVLSMVVSIYVRNFDRY